MAYNGWQLTGRGKAKILNNISVRSFKNVYFDHVTYDFTKDKKDLLSLPEVTSITITGYIDNTYVNGFRVTVGDILEQPRSHKPLHITLSCKDGHKPVETGNITRVQSKITDLKLILNQDFVPLTYHP